MNRCIKLPEAQSFFLLGARATGKTWLLRKRFADSPGEYIDLLNSRDYTELSLHPEYLSHRIASLPEEGPVWVIIDEVQKVPELLNMVHLEIEAHQRSRGGVTNERPPQRQLRFVLTGSSARKLKRGNANMLAGRAFLRYLYPLITEELPEGVSLLNILQWGTLPGVISAESDEIRDEMLSAYTHTYLREEILAEQLAREAPPFRRFLEVAAQGNGEIVNYSAVARDVGVSPNTVQQYYQILEDTLLAYSVPPYHRSLRKRQTAGPKYFYFDIGVTRSLLGIAAHPVAPSTYGFGKTFEHFIFLEIYRRLSYVGAGEECVSYLRTKDGVEIDFLVERPGEPLIAIEVKSADNIRPDHLNALATIGRELGPNVRRVCLCRETYRRLVDGIEVLPWREGLAELGF